MQESTLVSIAKFLKIGNSKEEKKVGRTTPGITVIIFPLLIGSSLLITKLFFTESYLAPWRGPLSCLKHKLCPPTETIAQGYNLVWKVSNHSAGCQALVWEVLDVWGMEKDACPVTILV